MTTPPTAVRPQLPAAKLRRLLAVLSLAVALVALPAFRPHDASAMPTSERGALRACGTLGGRIQYNFFDGGFENYDMTCTTRYGVVLFVCSGFDIFVNCRL
jgi:hypothetical protein